VEVDPVTSKVVKTVFKLYNKEHYGSKAIAKYLNDKGITSLKGGMWTGQLIMKMLKNKTYIGIYELGRRSKVRTTSPTMENLKFISEKDFCEAQETIKENTKNPFAARPTRRGSLLLTGLLYCSDCGKKFTSQHHKITKQRQNGTTWVYERDSYRCASFLMPKTEQHKCCNRIYKAEDLEALIVRHAKAYLLTVDKEKLLNSQEDTIREQEQGIVEYLKKLTRERSQKEKEIQRLKDEVMKALVGESQFSHGLLSEMIQTKEMELVDLNEKHKTAQDTAEDLAMTLATRRSVCAKFNNWAERFDVQDTMDKKAMLINIIDKIVISADRAEVTYSIRFDGFGKDDIIISNDPQVDNDCVSEAFLASRFVNWDAQAR
jgi:hypothetical protein